MKFGNIAGVRDSLLAAAATYALTQSTSASTVTVLTNEARTRIRRMSEDEITVYDVLKKLASGELYTVPVEHEVLVAEMVRLTEGEKQQADCVRFLRSMKRRGLLEESAGAWMAVW